MTLKVSPDRLTTVASGRGLDADQRNAVWRYVLIVMVPIILIVVPFYVTDLDAGWLGTFTPLVMWLPTLAAVLVGRSLSPHRPLGRLLAATPIRPLRPIIVAMMATFFGLGLLALVTLTLSHVLGFTTVDLVTFQRLRDAVPELSIAQARSEVLGTLLLLPLYALGYSLLTTGEELGWRGFLLSMLRPLGFWRASSLIGLLWALWHLPLTMTYAYLGESAWREVLATSVNLLLSGYVLAGLRWLTGSVLPAAFGHAVLNTVLVYLYSTLPTSASQQDTVA